VLLRSVATAQLALCNALCAVDKLEMQHPGGNGMRCVA